MSTPTQRSLAQARARGMICEVVERWNPHARVRNDLFGFIDILCLDSGSVVAIQTTSRSNMSARIRKIEESPLLPEVLKAGWKVEVHGWVKNKSNMWEVKIFEF